MSSFLKGNFVPKNAPTARKDDGEDDLESSFEREALKHIGGSMAFVSKQKVIWDDEDGE